MTCPAGLRGYTSLRWKCRSEELTGLKPSMEQSFHSAGGLVIRFLEQELTDGCHLHVWPRISGFICLRFMALFPSLLINLSSTCTLSEGILTWAVSLLCLQAQHNILSCFCNICMIFLAASNCVYGVMEVQSGQQS